MISISIKGVDEFLASHVEKEITPKIAKILNISNEEILSTCFNSTIYHLGVDQTSFHMIVSFEMEEKYQQYEKDLADCVLELSRKFSVHAHVEFSYVSKKVYSRIDETYPLFVSESNEVMIENEEEEEVYTGDIFENFEERLKAKNKK